MPKCAEVSQTLSLHPVSNLCLRPKQGTPSSMCTHEITAHFTVADMAQRCDIRKNPGCWGEDYDKNHQVTLAQFPFSPCCGTQGIKLIYAGGHCHAPSCISMELFHADTGKLLCAHYPTYGKTHQVFVCPRCCRIFLRSLTNWATLLSHPASGAQKRLKKHFSGLNLNLS